VIASESQGTDLALAQPRLSVSLDGSKIALMDGTKEYLADPLQVFTFKPSIEKEETSPNESRISSLRKDLVLIPVKELNKELIEYCGFGKFHFISTKDRDLKDELFIACDGWNVDIYSVHPKWLRIRRITLADPDLKDKPIRDTWRLIEGLGGKYFSWSDANSKLLVCNLETGTLVYPLCLPRGTAYFSRNGKLMLCYHEHDTITTRWTESGTVLGIAKVSKPMLYQAFAAFIKNDEHIVVPLIECEDSHHHPGSLGMVLDTTTLSTVERVSFSNRYLRQQPQAAGSQGQYIYSLHGSKLDLIRLQDIVLPPYPQPRYQCNEECRYRLTKLKKPDVVWSTSDLKKTISPHPDLTISIQFQGGTNGYVVEVSVIDSEGTPLQTLEIPPYATDGIHGSASDSKFYLDKASMQLIVFYPLYVMVWKLPRTVEESVTLHTARKKHTEHADEHNQAVEVSTSRYTTDVAVCTHGQIYARFWDEDTLLDVLDLCKGDVFDHDPNQFFDGLESLILMFRDGSETFQQAALKYFGRYINRTVWHNGQTETILTKLCRDVTQENHDLYGDFLKAALESDHVRWVPRPDQIAEMNPISILLTTANSVPRAINLVQTMVSYCIRMAKKDEDPHFVSPVLESLQQLVELKDLHSELVLNTLRGLAYIPVPDQERSYVIDRAVVALPPRFWKPFWKSKARPIYMCKNPVLHLDRSPRFKEHVTRNERFTHDLFVASFDMLWSIPKTRRDTLSSIEKIKIKARSESSSSTIGAIFSILWLKMKIWSSKKVECYDLPLESLDNPAIAALIEYKW